jgi:hypothetical protein
LFKFDVLGIDTDNYIRYNIKVKKRKKLWK